MTKRFMSGPSLLKECRRDGFSTPSETAADAGGVDDVRHAGAAGAPDDAGVELGVAAEDPGGAGVELELAGVVAAVDEDVRMLAEVVLNRQRGERASVAVHADVGVQRPLLAEADVGGQADVALVMLARAHDDAEGRRVGEMDLEAKKRVRQRAVALDARLEVLRESVAEERRKAVVALVAIDTGLDLERAARAEGRRRLSTAASASAS